MTRRWVIAGLAASAALLALLLLREEAPPSGVGALLVAPRATPAVPEFDVSREAAASVAANPNVRELQPLAQDGDAPPVEADSAVTFVVRHADGVPARGCVVAVAAGEQVAWSEIAASDGSVHGDAVAGPVTVWVGGATLVPASFPLAEARGRQELLLPAGEVIDGRLLVDGGPPPEPVPALGLELDDEGFGAVPWFVRSALRPSRPGVSVGDEAPSAFVGADGSFRFSGLPAGWAGRFAPPYTYWADDERELEAHAPEHGRILELHRVPHIRFRVVSAGERAPVPLARGQVTAFGSGNCTGYGIVCDADGRGEVTMVRWEPTVKVGLELADVAGTSRVTASFDVADASHDLDLGDIELQPRWSIPFRVTEPDGTPIAGAIGGTECESSVRSEGTDDTGLARLDGVPPGCAELRVGAAGHEPATVALPPQPPLEPVAVTLARCASLNVHVASDDGELRPGLWLALHTERHVSAADAASAFHESALQLGVLVSGVGSQYGRAARPQADGSVLQLRNDTWRLRTFGDCALGCMEPGAPVKLDIMDRSQFLLWSKELRLQPGEQREEAVVLSGRSQTLDVLVTDQAGAPLADAQVQVRASRGAAERASSFAGGEQTDAAGRARFENLYAPALDLTCELDGYVSAGLAAVAPGPLAHILLQRGLVVTLHCIDPQGRPALVDGAWAHGDQKLSANRVDATPNEDSQYQECATWRFSGLKPGLLHVEVNAGGRSFRLEHDAAIPEATLVVPEFGALVVCGLQAAKDKAHATLSARLEGADDVALVDGLSVGHIARDRLTWPLAFPGTYRVELRVGDEVVAGPAEVEVRAGETAQLTLH